VKRLLAIPILALALAVSAAVAPAALDDANGPTCVDITDTSWLYSPDGATATVDITLDRPSCRFVTYSVVVQDEVNVTTVVARHGVGGDGTEFAPGSGFDIVSVSVTIPSGERDGKVCLFATTSIGPHVFDRAPDADLTPNCIDLVPGGTGGGTGAN
jgi:hypothetical protein